MTLQRFFDVLRVLALVVVLYALLLEVRACRAKQRWWREDCERKFSPVICDSLERYR